MCFDSWVWDLELGDSDLEFGIWNIDFVGFFERNLEFGILGLEFCSLGVRIWDSVLGFEVWCLEFGMFEFGILVLEFGDRNFGNGIW